MATFPGAIPSYSTMDPNQTTSAAGHTARHNAIQLDLIAVATKVGADSSADTSSIDFRLSGVSGGDKAVSRSGTETLANKTLNSSTLNSPVITGGTWSSATIDKPTIADFTNANHDHGSALKGGSLSTNTVNTSQLVDGAVTTAKLGTKAVDKDRVAITFQETDISGNGQGTGPTALTGSITASLPAGVTYDVEITAYGSIYSNATGATSAVNVYKNGSKIQPDNELLTPAADRHFPWHQTYVTTAVNGDIFAPYRTCDNGSAFNGLASTGHLTMKVLGRH